VPLVVIDGHERASGNQRRFGRVEVMKLCSVHLLVAVVLAVGAGTVHAGDKCRQAPARTSDDYLQPGPYAVGSATITFVDTSRVTPASGPCAEKPSRTLPTTVWFPATSPDGAFVDPGGAPYPLIAYSHGLGSHRTAEQYLARHLATWGYIVSSQDFPLTNLFNIACVRLADLEKQPTDVSFVIDSVLAQYGSAIDTTRIAAAGLSYGGGTTLLVTFHPQVRDPRIRASLAIAPTACWATKRFFKSADVPLMLLAGTSAMLLPEAQNAARAYKASQAPKWLVLLKDGSHLGFTNLLGAQSGTPHPDAVGCAGLGGIVSAQKDNPLMGLGGKENGIKSTPKRCALPCSKEVPDSAMPPAEQQELARIAGLAFFEGTLRNDLAARCFLHDQFAAEQEAVRVNSR
jgi:dienelactone hydrolase